MDQKLANINSNFDLVHENVEKLISKWQCYKLTVQGRITITKSLLLSQYTYVGTVLDMNKCQTDLIQNKLNAFVLHNQKYDSSVQQKRNWLKPEYLYGAVSQGGL